jgi:hypothetical protein
MAGRRSKRPWDIRIISLIWRDDDFKNLSAMAQWLAFRSISQLGMDRSEGGLSYTAADFGLDPIMFELLARELVHIGIFCWVDDDRVEVHSYKDLIFPVPVRYRRPIPPGTRERVFKRDGNRCQHCGKTERLEIDHIFPWSLGGDEEETNLQVLCRTCNWRKGASV